MYIKEKIRKTFFNSKQNILGQLNKATVFFYYYEFSIVNELVFHGKTGMYI